VILVDPLTAPTGSRRRRWEVWRSPGDQPSWARPALLGIAAVAAFLYAWNITEAGLAPFYSVAVKSMSESWKAFIYGALDPQATITIDKLAGSFWPQALSARIFGFHPWSLALPQVIEGVVSVLVMYRVVRRWAGVVPGLLAAAIFTLTPIAASMYGHSMEDGALTMCLVLAADAYQRAVMQARLRSLIWAGVWVGLGFQTKMLQAWMILPALALVFALPVARAEDLGPVDQGKTAQGNPFAFLRIDEMQGAPNTREFLGRKIVRGGLLERALGHIKEKCVQAAFFAFKA